MRPTRSVPIALASFATAALLLAQPARADDTDARNFITNATGSTTSQNDPRIAVVNRQLESIRSSCAQTSRGAAIHDKLVKAHSLLTTQQSLLVLLEDFVRVARAQCSRMDDSLLISLYVIERNSGSSHATTISRLIKDPGSLARKWRS